MTKSMQKHHIINYKNLSIQVTIKKNKLSKYYSLTFDRKNLRGLVSIPYSVTYKSGLEYVSEEIDWLYSEIKKIFPLILIKHNTSLLIMGKKVNVIYEKSKSHKIIFKKNIITIKSEKKDHKIILKKWIKEQLLRESRKYIEMISLKLGQNIRKIKLSNSFNYWGSCNSKGDIYINWRLVFAPTKVLKYIIVHELCHLKEFNHTKDFWKLVQKLCPNYKDQIVWLNENDNYLYKIRFD